MITVDDLKLSHAEESILNDLTTSLKAEYGKVGKMTICREKIHYYLVMAMDFSYPGKFFVGMEKYLDVSVLKD